MADGVIGVQQQLGRPRQWTSRRLKEARKLRHHEGDEDDNEADSRHDQHRGIYQGLLNLILKRFYGRDVLYQPPQNLRQRAGSLARGDHVDVERGEDAREIAHGMGETASVHQPLMQRFRETLQTRLLEPAHKNAKSLIQRHARGQEVRELLRKQKELRKRERKPRVHGRRRGGGDCGRGGGRGARG